MLTPLVMGHNLVLEVTARTIPFINSSLFNVVSIYLFAFDSAYEAVASFANPTCTP